MHISNEQVHVLNKYHKETPSFWKIIFWLFWLNNSKQLLSSGFLTYNYCCTLPLTVLSLCVSFTVTIINCYCSYAFHRFLLNFPFWYHMKHKKTTGFLIFRGSKGTLTLKSFIMNFREFLFHRKAISDFTWYYSYLT